MTLQKYELKLMYIPGKQSIIADTLSHACISNSMQEIKDSVIQYKKINIQWVTIKLKSI